MKQYFTNIWDGIKKDLTPVHKDFKYTLMWCGALTISTFFSLFFGWAVWITLALCIGAVFVSKGGRAAYVMVFMMPLAYIFVPDKGWNKYPPLLFCVFSLLILVLLIKYVKALVCKQKQLEHWHLGFLLALIFLLLMPFSFTEFTLAISFIAGAIFLFLMWNNRKDIDVQEIFLLLLLGLLICFLFGFLVQIEGIRAAKYFQYMHQQRYQGIYASPNRLGGDGLICLVLLLVLRFNGKTKYMFFPVFAFLTIAIMMSGSKARIVVLAFVVIVFLIWHIIKNIKNKSSLRSTILFITAVIILCIVCCLTCISFLNKTFERFLSIEEDKIVSTIDTITTYRYGIWSSYFEAILSNIWRFLFGFGGGAPYLHTNKLGYIMNAHNSFITLLYYVGIAGLAIIATWALLLFIPMIKQKKVNWFNTVVVTIVLVGLFMVDEYYWHVSAMFLLILLPLITYRGVMNKQSKSINAPEIF